MPPKVATGNRAPQAAPDPGRDAGHEDGSKRALTPEPGGAVAEEADVDPRTQGAPAVGLEGGRFVSLDVPEFLPSVVWIPRGSRRKPLLVATHGAGGRPEAHCERWRELVGDRAFVLCVRGAKINRSEPLSVSRHYYPDHLWLGRAIDANLAAFEARFSATADAANAVYAGYSQGAVMGALMLMSRADRFPRALLIEGQQNDWSVSGAKRWQAAGGRRVGLVCGLLHCSQAYERSRQSLRRGGVDVRFEYAPGAGHTYQGRVGAKVGEVLEWVVAGDPRWSAE
ncbi:MAG: hypothetical protein R3B89_08550 [Polyangiaceae bacterium]